MATIPARAIPSDYEAAIAAIVELDVQKWGEAERDASTRMRRAGAPTYGLALNTLAHRPEYDYGDAWPECVAAARQAMTASDRSKLRSGG